MACGAALTPERDDPRRGETGVVVRFGSGGVEPNPLSGHGGCNRRGSIFFAIDGT